MAAIILTEANFEKEKALCNVIFLTYSDFLLNASVNKLISEKHYLGNCMFLDALVHLVNSYTYEDSVFYLGGVVIPQEEILQIIDYIHHYYSGRLNMSVDEIIAMNDGSIFDGNTGGGNTGDILSPSYGCLYFFLDIPAESDATHNVNVATTAVLLAAFLNGNKVSDSHWAYANKIFTYTGPVELTAIDQFSLFFANNCGTTQETVGCKFSEGAGGVLTFVSPICRFGNAVLTFKQ